MNRPATSKARGACRYYMTPRGCFAGDKCKFLHGQEQVLTPYDESKSCIFYAQGTNQTTCTFQCLLIWLRAGYCRRGEECWFRHAPQSSTSQQQDEPSDSSTAEDVCNICLEKPTTYGLLSACPFSNSPDCRLTPLPAGCGHIFCIKVGFQ